MAYEQNQNQAQPVQPRDNRAEWEKGVNRWLSNVGPYVLAGLVALVAGAVWHSIAQPARMAVEDKGPEAPPQKRYRFTFSLPYGGRLPIEGTLEAAETVQRIDELVQSVPLPIRYELQGEIAEYLIGKASDGLDGTEAQGAMDIFQRKKEECMAKKSKYVANK